MVQAARFQRQLPRIWRAVTIWIKPYFGQRNSLRRRSRRLSRLARATARFTTFIASGTGSEGTPTEKVPLFRPRAGSRTRFALHLLRADNIAACEIPEDLALFFSPKPEIKSHIRTKQSIDLVFQRLQLFSLQHPWIRAQ